MNVDRVGEESYFTNFPNVKFSFRFTQYSFAMVKCHYSFIHKALLDCGLNKHLITVCFLIKTTLAPHSQIHCT